jgi:hypothetical protein
MYVRRSRSLQVWLTVLAVAISLAATRRASAQEGVRLQVNWDAFAETYRGLVAQATGHGQGHEGEGANVARLVSVDESPWLGAGIVVSLVARDWQGATRLVGGPLAVTDAIRTSRSSRMVVARIGLGGGRIVPFVHLGGGQWRDPDQHRYDAPLEIAGEAGGGFEAKLTRSFACALEYDHTTLFRDTPRSDAVAPSDDGLFIVAHLEY